jgi:hypothetical protein
MGRKWVMLAGGSAYTKAHAEAGGESQNYVRAAAEIKDACILTRVTKNAIVYKGAPRRKKKRSCSTAQRRRGGAAGSSRRSRPIRKSRIADALELFVASSANHRAAHIVKTALSVAPTMAGPAIAARECRLGRHPTNTLRGGKANARPVAP